MPQYKPYGALNEEGKTVNRPTQYPVKAASPKRSTGTTGMTGRTGRTGTSGTLGQWATALGRAINPTSIINGKPHVSTGGVKETTKKTKKTKKAKK